MNRELKFRIWDKTEKTFTNISPSFVCGSEEKVFEFCGSLYQRKNWVIQQFTGLYDKNKKPIYEGDIITGMFNMGPAGEVLQTAPVHWDNLNNYQWNYWNLDTIEVIGNIFQLPCNPDHNGECLVCDERLSDCPLFERTKLQLI